MRASTTNKTRLTAAAALLLTLAACGGGGGGGGGFAFFAQPGTPSTPSESPHAGFYAVRAGSLPLYFTVSGQGSIGGCGNGPLAHCTGTVAADGSFYLEGDDGQEPVQTRISLDGRIQNGVLSGHYRAVTPTAGASSGAFSGAPGAATSRYAGRYNLSGGGVTIALQIDSDGGIRCVDGTLIVCSGRVDESGHFNITGNDGESPVDTTATLSGRIGADDQVSGSYTAQSVSEGSDSGSFSGTRLSHDIPTPSPAAGGDTGGGGGGGAGEGTGGGTSGTSVQPSAIGVALDGAASGSINWRRISAGSAADSGSFSPSADGFETEVTLYNTLYRWIDRTQGRWLEVSRSHLAGQPWRAVLYENTAKPYPSGFGEGWTGEQIGLPASGGFCSSSLCEITVTGGTSAQKSVSVSFANRAGAPAPNFASEVLGTLEGSAPDYLWEAIDLPKGSEGDLTFNGNSRAVLSVQGSANGLNQDPSYTINFTDGTWLLASTQSASGVSIVSFHDGSSSPHRCRSDDWGSNPSCAFTVSTPSEGVTRLAFAGLTLKASGAPDIALSGQASYDRAFSTLTSNGKAFAIAVDHPTNNLVASSVKAVGSLLHYQFSPSHSEGGAWALNLWMQNALLMQVLVPTANGNQFLCTRAASHSSSNVFTQYAPEHTIEACPAAMTGHFKNGEGLRGFEFQDFRFAGPTPSVYSQVVPQMVLDGTIWAKGR